MLLAPRKLYLYVFNGRVTGKGRRKRERERERERVEDRDRREVFPNRQNHRRREETKIDAFKTNKAQFSRDT